MPSARHSSRAFGGAATGSSSMTVLEKCGRRKGRMEPDFIHCRAKYPRWIGYRPGPPVCYPSWIGCIRSRTRYLSSVDRKSLCSSPVVTMSSSPHLRRPRIRLPRHDPEALKRLYRTQILGLPGPVDRWLVTNSRTGGSLNFLKNYMYLVDLDCNHNVRCLVQRRRDDAIQDDTDFINPPTYTLILMCWINSASRVPWMSRGSPRVCLDRYVGFPSELNAPDWVRDDRDFVEFFQPRCVIAETFVQLSMSSMNQSQQNLPARMVEWATAITVGLWPVHSNTPTLSTTGAAHADGE